jgi:ornithine--oxo-acid transaminase
MIVHILANVSLNGFEIRDSLVPVFCEMFGRLQALIVSCCGCFHGRTLGVISMSCDNDATRGFGPLVPGHLKVDFGDTDGLEKIFKDHGERICGFLFEPIQGEAGVCIF